MVVKRLLFLWNITIMNVVITVMSSNFLMSMCFGDRLRNRADQACRPLNVDTWQQYVHHWRQLKQDRLAGGGLGAPTQARFTERLAS